MAHKKQRPLPRSGTAAVAHEPGRTRTGGLLLRRQTLYPPELRAPIYQHDSQWMTPILVSAGAAGSCHSSAAAAADFSAISASS